MAKQSQSNPHPESLHPFARAGGGSDHAQRQDFQQFARPSEFRTMAEGMDQRLLLTSADAVFQRSYFTTGDVCFMAVRRPPSLATGAFKGTSTIISFPLSGGPTRLNGIAMDRPYMFVLRRGAELESVEPRPWLVANIILGGDLEDPIDDGESQFSLYLDAERLFAPLRDFLVRALEASATDPGLFYPASVATSLRNDIRLGLMAVSARIREERLMPTPLPCSFRLVREIDDYLALRRAANICVSELAKTFGRSVRSIHDNMASVRGVGLRGYLIKRRLADARLALETATPGTLVKTIALEHGFWNLGRFAADYFHLFAEKPSETLRRALA